MNKTGLMIDIMKMELGKFNNIKKKFIEEFSEMDCIYIEKVKKHPLVLDSLSNNFLRVGRTRLSDVTKETKHGVSL